MNINANTVYFVGIGGIGMSAAAGLAAQSGLKVSGSDSKEIYNPAKDVLDKNHIQYFTGYNAENAKNSNADLFVISAGETFLNPEVKWIYENLKAHCGLGKFLHTLAADKIRIVITGTHGKSTTTGFLGSVLKTLDDSSFFTGGVFQGQNTNFYKGEGHYFVFEGDEYKEEFDDPTPKFHFYKPDILVLTNLEYDHPDVFESFEALEEEFRLLINSLPPDGILVYNADNIHLAKLALEAPCNTVSFGIDNDADFKVEHIEYGQYTKFEVLNKFSKDETAQILSLTEDYQTQLPGKINVYNALACVASLRVLGFKPEQLALEVLAFRGIKRRFELVAEKNGITIIDDYAHHPTAVKETLAAARLKYFSGLLNPNPQALNPKLWAVFEPHTFSRTKATLNELTEAFEDADEVLISEIYPAREKIQAGNITSEEVVKEIKSRLSTNTKQVRKVKDKQEALNILKTEAKPGDVIVVMAVGAFNRLAYEFKEII